MFYTISNILFVGFVVTLLVSIIFFEIGIRAFRNGQERKSKESNRNGFRWLAISGLLFVLSFLIGLIK